MNIKRMANEYRNQVKGTGNQLLKEINNLTPWSCFHHHRTDIKRWYNHLQKALGSEKDLKKLLSVWEGLVKISKIPEGTEKDKYQCLFSEVQNQMKDFVLKKLPSLIEKSLTRSVRESGIRLR
jgi:predicted translin family RNA/ssDNA-binding protein